MFGCQLLSNLQSNIVDEFAIDYGVRSCKIDIFEDAVRNILLLVYLVALHLVAGDYQRFTRTHIPHKLAIVHIDRHALACHDVTGCAFRFDFSDAEWLESERIPHSNQNIV